MRLLCLITYVVTVIVVTIIYFKGKDFNSMNSGHYDTDSQLKRRRNIEIPSTFGPNSPGVLHNYHELPENVTGFKASFTEYNDKEHHEYLNHLGEIYTGRLNNLLFQCFSNRNVTKQMEFNEKEFNLHFAHALKLAFCKVPKCGSTFWMQLFLAVSKKQSTNNLFGRKRVDLHIMSADLQQNYVNIQEDYTVFLMTRNPFSRLYSAYIDKIYLPAMGHTALYIARRSNKSCGKEVTFEDFLRIVVDLGNSGHSLDPHWTPVYKTCHPCKVPYNVVAKQETYLTDVKYILSRVNISEEMRASIIRNAHQKHTNNTIVETVKHIIVLAQIEYNKKAYCLSFIEFCRRLWTSFVIQGYIHQSIDFPMQRFTNLTYSNVQAIIDVFLDHANTITMSLDTSHVQRHGSMAMAYKDISMDIISEIKVLYDLDFKYFGYSYQHPVPVEMEEIHL